VTLVAPAAGHGYSGMIPGHLAGRYHLADLRFDVPRLAERAGIHFRPGLAAGMDLGTREVLLADGGRLPFDVVSFAVGADVAGRDLPGVQQHALFLRPIDAAARIVPAVETAVAGRGSAVHAAVVGGGSAGVEVALAMRGLLRRLGQPDGRVTLVEGQAVVLSDRGPAAAREATRALASNRVTVLLGSTVVAVDRNTVHLPDGKKLAVDVVIWAAGPAAPGLFRASGLATDGAGYLLVGGSLESVSHPGVFAAGDAATLASAPATPKAGVYAVREARVLGHNLALASAGESPARYHHYRPQRRFLALLNTGDGRAILSYGPFALTAGWVMCWKDRIDRRFVRRFGRIGL
jgi:selenide,water dikinase